MKNIIAFHGCDNKDGCTMVAQSVAMAYAKKNKEAQVLFFSLSNTPNNQFTDISVISLKNYKEKIKRGIDIKKSELEESKLLERVYFLESSGLFDFLETSYSKSVNSRGLEQLAKDTFSCDMEANLESMLAGISRQFDLVVLDTGCSVPNKLSGIGLKLADKRLLVTTGGEASVSRLFRDKDEYEAFGIKFEGLIINKSKGAEEPVISYISDMFPNTFEKTYSVRETGSWRTAELMHKTFFELKSLGFSRDINRIVKELSI